MVLAAVEYELFEFEDQSPSVTELSRQVRLQFSDAAPLYISWTWENCHSDDDEAYSLGFGEASYFTEAPFGTIDASESELWQPHIGRSVTLTWRDVGHQILEVSSDRGATFLFSLGRDVVELSARPPKHTTA